MTKSKLLKIFFLLALAYSLQLTAYSLYAQEDFRPVIVNSDNVEYSTTDAKRVTFSGNVVIIYKGTKLTCQKVSVNTQTKDAQAEGDVRIEDERGIIKGEKMSYNFETKSGVIYDADFMAQPYFGKAKKLEKLSDIEFVGTDAHMTTCNLDQPHYRFKARKLDFFRGDKIQTKDAILYLGGMPTLYLPHFNRSLRDNQMHVQIVPGKSKDWGTYLLTATRYNLSQSISGRIYLDYRDRLGVAEGFGANYKSSRFGRGDFKYYYTQERDRSLPESTPAEFQRYFIRWRHRWDISPQTQMTSEYYKIVDAKRMVLGTKHNILKDYYFREYEKDSLPLSYILLHHYFRYSSLDMMIQKRTNRWYQQLEKLPEVKYTLPSIRLGQSPLYFESKIQAANFNYKYAVPSPASSDVQVNRIDAANKLSLPFRLAFIHLKPFVMSRQTYYSEDIHSSSISPRTVFYTGADLSTKFYRIFPLKTHFLGLDVDGLRHIITPSISYSYNHDPTIASSRLKQIDVLDAIGSSNVVSLALSNKLQTKRKGKTIDLVNLKVSTAYNFYTVDPETNIRSRDSLADFLIDLELLPFSWLRVDAEATYKPQEHYISQFDYDLKFIFGKERSLGLGQRYLRDSANEITSRFIWRLNPKWKFSTYHRYCVRGDPSLSYSQGLREQEYAVSRDLHCWTMELAVNSKKYEGTAVWLIFRLKAFPELEFNFSQSLYQPKSGAQPE